MAVTRQKDCAKHLHVRRMRTTQAVLAVLSRRRYRIRYRRELYRAASSFLEEAKALSLRYLRTLRIASISFDITFERLSEQQSLEYFRFPRTHIIKLADYLGLQTPRTKRNYYSTTPLLSTCLVLLRLVSPCRWSDIAELFGKHPSHMSEIFWETAETFAERYSHLLTSQIPPSMMQNRAALYARAISDKTNALPNCVGFIDARISIARPTGHSLQNVAYNGHKRTHCMKFQTITTPDRYVVHSYGPTEGRRHDWYLYTAAGTDEMLEAALLVDMIQYCLYGDSGYNHRAFLEVPYEGTTLSPPQQALNTAMSGGRITVEWLYKEVKLYWSTIDFKRKMKVKESPVGLLYIVVITLMNFRNCIHPNMVSLYFDSAPLTLDEYITVRSGSDSV